jgi:hypothetical protein
MSDDQQPDQPKSLGHAGVREKHFQRLLAALLSLTFTALVLILPPITNRQLAHDEQLIEKPLLGTIVAVVLLIFSLWSRRFVVAVVAVCVVVALIQLAFFFTTTQPGRDAQNATDRWTDLPMSASYEGVVPHNTPDVFGEASTEWAGSSVTLSLRSKTGTTQQGIHEVAPPNTQGFYFSATVTNITGGNSVICPLIFGITDIRNYFTFRVQDTPGGSPEVVAYQIIQNSSTFTSGFHSLLLGQDTNIPYYNTWNIIQPDFNSESTMAMMVTGSYGKFYLDGRNVFSMPLAEIPKPYVVSVGATVLANDLQAAANCTFSNVTFRVEPPPGGNN